MPKRITLPQAAELTGLSEYALRQGCKEKRYPHIRTGGYKGKYLFDPELLERYLEQEAVDNIQNVPNEYINYGKLRVISE